jgi:FkbM family methyltransferase
MSSIDRDNLMTILSEMSLADRLELAQKMDNKIRLDYDKEIWLMCNSVTELRTRSNSCKKEPETIEWLHEFLQSDDVFYDVGANVGAYSLVAAKIYNNIKVYAFEPGYSSFFDLVENIKINKSESIIYPVNIALSEKTSIGVFNYSSTDAGEASHAFGDALDQYGESFKPVMTQVMSSYSIDDIVNYIEPPTIVKIDVDGIEKDVLLGGRKILTSGVVKTLLIELVDGDKRTKEVIDLLDDMGFVVKSSHPYTYGVSNSTNYIFIRK